MNEIISSPEPSTTKYIWVYGLSGIFMGIVITIVDTICGVLFIDLNNITASDYWLLAPIIKFAVFAMMSIGMHSYFGMYPYFNTLKIGRVIPWMVVVGALSVPISIVRTYLAFNQAGLPFPPIFIVSMLGSFGFSMFLVNKYFKTKQPHRY